MSLLTSYNPFDVYNHYSKFSSIRHKLTRIISGTEDSHPIEEKLRHAYEGSLKFADAYVLKKIIHREKPGYILEVGSFLGMSAHWMLEVSKPFNSIVTAVDPNIRHRIFDNPRSIVERLNAAYYPDRLEIVTAFFGYCDEGIYHDYEHYQPCLTREQVDKLIGAKVVIGRDWGRKFDLIFIDGNHKYKSVMNNFEVAYGLLDKGGSIVFHDALSWPDVTKALLEMKETYKNRAEVTIYGAADRKILRQLKIHNDGLGVFKLTG